MPASFRAHGALPPLASLPMLDPGYQIEKARLQIQKRRSIERRFAGRLADQADSSTNSLFKRCT